MFADKNASNPIEDYTFIPAFSFDVRFIGVNGLPDKETGWQEVTGLSKELSVDEVTEGGENSFVWRLPKPAKYKNLILKRAVKEKDDGIAKWASKAIDEFEFETATVVVSIRGEEDNGQPIRTWNFVDAYPVKYVTTDFNAQKDGLIIETLELAYKYFTVT